MSVLNFATSPNSGVKLFGGFLRSEKTIFRFIFAGGASFSLFCIILLLRSRDAEDEFGQIRRYHDVAKDVGVDLSGWDLNNITLCELHTVKYMGWGNLFLPCLFL